MRILVLIYSRELLVNRNCPSCFTRWLKETMNAVSLLKRIFVCQMRDCANAGRHSVWRLQSFHVPQMLIYGTVVTSLLLVWPLTCCIGRLLPVDRDCWVHLNCALWSYEVFEAQDGTLFNVDKACRNGLNVDCTFCRRRGATLSCFEPGCSRVYHLRCAVIAKACFSIDKVWLCWLVLITNETI